MRAATSAGSALRTAYGSALASASCGATRISSAIAAIRSSTSCEPFASSRAFSSSVTPGKRAAHVSKASIAGRTRSVGKCAVTGATTASPPQQVGADSGSGALALSSTGSGTRPATGIRASGERVKKKTPSARSSARSASEMKRRRMFTMGKKCERSSTHETPWEVYCLAHASIKNPLRAMCLPPSFLDYREPIQITSCALSR